MLARVDVSDPCLMNSTGSNTLCVTESLTGLQTLNGPFTATALQRLLGQIVSSGVPPLPQSITCTDCAKATFNVFQQGFPGLVGSDAADNVNQQCGATFSGKLSVLVQRGDSCSHCRPVHHRRAEPARRQADRQLCHSIAKFDHT